MRTAIPSPGDGGAAIDPAANPASRSCPRPHNLPDAPLRAAGWQGSLATLSQFIQVGTTFGAALVSITPKGTQAPASVLRLEGQGGLTLSGLVAHALL